MDRTPFVSSSLVSSSRPFLAVLLLVGALWAHPALADDMADPDVAVGDGRWAFALGAFDVGVGGAHLEGGVEYRFDPVRLWRLDLTPMVGASASEDGNYWVYAGAGWSHDFADRWRVTPSFAFTAYEDGSGKRLGGVLEFRSGIELSVRTERAGRFGLLLYHLSNAGIYDFNPGSESLVLTWSPSR